MLRYAIVFALAAGLCVEAISEAEASVKPKKVCDANAKDCLSAE